MIHQSQLFVCPDESHGIAWNICLGRQACDWEKCDQCPYRGWQEKGLPGFNPYVGAFTPTEDPRKRLATAPRKPRCRNIYQGKLKKPFLPSDIGLEDGKSDQKGLWRSLKRVYSLI